MRPVAIIDIGSNSVRLVVYAGARRVPAPIFNEKVLAGLGAGLAETGALSPESQLLTLAALARFRLLIQHMGVSRTRVVATAAVRDAANGPEFVEAIERVGFDCEVLSAEHEAWLAGEGVLSAIPGAEGVVGDLGGGSLELVEVGGGVSGTGISLPLGVLRVKPGGASEKKLAATIADALASSGLAARARGKTLYMVGGSWRSLARIDMIARGYPLQITHQYQMAPARAEELRRIVSSPEPAWSKTIAAARLASSPTAAMVLTELVEQLDPGALVMSSFGIREGLLFSELAPGTRRKDPLIEGARDAGGAERRFGEHGDLLERWIGGLFDDPPAMRRLRLAACVLADVAWQANPDFRADRGVEMALHGNWVGVTASERVIMAQALSSNFGRDKLPDPALAELCSRAELDRAHCWGLAMRLAQRLCGGVGSALQGTRLETDGETLSLIVDHGVQALIGDTVKRRLNRLAHAMQLEPAVNVEG